MPKEGQSLNKLLCEIQTKLKAPKNHFNNFGKYHYRNCEDILEAAKPLLAERNLTLRMTDSVEAVGDRVYVIATVGVFGDDGSIEVQAAAREPLTRKGMDESQLTGTASSYARKYALNGLFAIDDTKDADTQPPPEQKPQQQPQQPAQPPQQPPPTEQPQRPALTEPQRATMNALLTYFTKQIPDGRQLDRNKLASVVFEKMGNRWPESVEDATYIKQYVQGIDVSS